MIEFYFFSSKVELNPLLHEAVVNPKEGYKEFLRWDEIFSRLLGKMAPAFRISRQGQVPIIRKGKLEPIEIAVAKRTGNKKVRSLLSINVLRQVLSLIMCLSIGALAFLRP